MVNGQGQLISTLLFYPNHLLSQYQPKKNTVCNKQIQLITLLEMKRFQISLRLQYFNSKGVIQHL